MFVRRGRYFTGGFVGLFCCITAGSVFATEYDTEQFMEMDLAQLMEITITSVSKKPQSLSDAAAAVYVISQEDIRRSGVTSIPEALRMAPGIQAVQISASKWSVSSRGFAGYTSNKLLVLIDGRSVYTPAYSGTFWDMQHTMLEDIDRIEVIRGPGGTLWGANAVNGVINIITKSAKDTEGTLVKVGTGNENKLMAGARYGQKINENVSGRFYVSGNNRDSNVLEGGNDDAYDGWGDAEAGFRFDGAIGDQDEWSVHGDLYKTDGDQIVYPLWTADSAYPISDYSSNSSSGGNLVGNWLYTLDNSDRFSIKAYYDYNDREESYYEQTFNTFDIEAQYETSIGDRNSLTAGVGYRNIDGEFVSSYSVSIPDQTNELYSAFVQDEIKLVDDLLWLTVGTKYEHNDFTGNEWQPSARLLWKPKDDHSLWASVARAVRTPSMIEDSGSITLATIANTMTDPPPEFLNMRLQGNEDYISEELVAYETGYRWQALDTLFIDLSAYYNDYDDLYGTEALDPLTMQFDNKYEGYGYGAELALNWQATQKTSFALTYAYQELNLELKDKAIVAVRSNVYDDGTAEHSVGLRSSTDMTEEWQVNWWFRYIGEIEGVNTTDPMQPITVPAYADLDVNIIWKPSKNLEVMLAVSHLLEDERIQYVSELITPVTEIERSVYGKITWKF